MGVRRNSFVLLALGGLAATAVAVGVSPDARGVPLVTGPVAVAGSTPGLVPRPVEETPWPNGWQAPPSTDKAPTPNTDEAPTLDELQLPTGNIPLTPTARENVRRTIGKLYAEFPDGTKRAGTATVVTSDSQDLLVTAGQLVSRPSGDGTPQVATKVQFEPEVSNGPGPFGVWHAREWAVVPGSDIGMVLLYSRQGRHIQEAVWGSQGICFNCPQQAFVHVYGYPKDFADGNDLDLHCQVNADFSAGPDHPYGPCLEGARVMGEGAEGAPVIADFDPTSGIGHIMAVHTRGFPSQAGFPIDQGAAYLGTAARDLYQRLQNKRADPVKLTIRVTNRGGYDAATSVTLPGGEPITDCDIPHLAVNLSATRECGIPGGGSFVVHGLAISAREKELTISAVPTSVLCITHYGTTFGFNIVNEPCEQG